MKVVNALNIKFGYNKFLNSHDHIKVFTNIIYRFLFNSHLQLKMLSLLVILILNLQLNFLKNHNASYAYKK